MVCFGDWLWVPLVTGSADRKRSGEAGKRLPHTLVTDPITACSGVTLSLQMLAPPRRHGQIQEDDGPKNELLQDGQPIEDDGYDNPGTPEQHATTRAFFIPPSPSHQINIWLGWETEKWFS